MLAIGAALIITPFALVAPWLIHELDIGRAYVPWGFPPPIEMTWRDVLLKVVPFLSLIVTVCWGIYVLSSSRDQRPRTSPPEAGGDGVDTGRVTSEWSGGRRRVVVAAILSPLAFLTICCVSAIAFQALRF